MAESGRAPTVSQRTTITRCTWMMPRQLLRFSRDANRPRARRVAVVDTGPSPLRSCVCASLPPFSSSYLLRSPKYSHTTNGELLTSEFMLKLLDVLKPSRKVSASANGGANGGVNGGRGGKREGKRGSKRGTRSSKARVRVRRSLVLLSL